LLKVDLNGLNETMPSQARKTCNILQLLNCRPVIQWRNITMSASSVWKSPEFLDTDECCSSYKFIFVMHISSCSLPTLTKQQEKNTVPSDSTILVNLDGVMGFTKSSTKFNLGIAMVLAECDGHLFYFGECISGVHANGRYLLLVVFFAKITTIKYLQASWDPG
jgi:hypothetical protein